jgi:hypothetical protein
MPDRDEGAAVAVRDAIDSYLRRAEVLRQIHGRKGTVARRWEVAYLVVTVFVATVVTAFAFASPERIASLLPTWLVPAQSATAFVELAFNIAVLIILILTLVGLIYRYGERASQHFRSVEILTEFIRDVEDAVILHDAGARLLAAADLDTTRVRYKGILGALPANTDREYLRAKRAAKKKREQAHGVERPKKEPAVQMKARLVTSELSPGDFTHAEELARIVEKDPSRVEVLRTVEHVFGDRGWVIGGFIREAVWDALTGAPIPPPLHEVDVSYFDSTDTSKATERLMESRLHSEIRNVDWSVKNQARMHLVNDHEPYVDVTDALKRAPETASSVAIQLAAEELRVLAPVGLADLFEMKLRRSELADPRAFDSRVGRIAAPGRWPNLERVTDG